MKNIIKIAVITIVAMQVSLSVAQNNTIGLDDIGRIAISVYIDHEKTQLPSNAYALLQNKMQTMVTKNGMGSAFNQRFIITAKSSITTKDITTTANPMHTYTVDVTFYIGDGLEGTLFSTTSINTKGVGETPEKAYIAALKNIKTNDPSYEDFIKQGKEKIVAYYNSQCDIIIENAKNMATIDNFDKAIYMLMNIPDVCKECYTKAQKQCESIYKQKIDKECNQILTEATAIWSNRGSENELRYAAHKASELLGSINPNAKCYQDALVLIKQIGKKMEEIDKREWDMKVKMEQHAHEENINQITARKEIAVEFAKNQPNTITYIIPWW